MTEDDMDLLANGYGANAAEAKWLVAEVRRLRALVKAAEIYEGDTGGWSVCNWCEAGIFDLHSNKREPHKPDCPAFTPEGEVR